MTLRQSQGRERTGARLHNRIARGNGKGGFPAHPDPPARPLICFLYPDLNLEIGPAPAPILGQYPRGFLRKLQPWLRCSAREVLHVCSGALPMGEGHRVDLRQEALPDLRADGRALPIRDAAVAAVLIDPPYTEHYARELYDVDYPRPAQLLREAVRVVRPGGRVGIVHYITPKPPSGARLIKVFGLSTGFDFPIRAVSLYERDQAELFGEVPR